MANIVTGKARLDLTLSWRPTAGILAGSAQTLNARPGATFGSSGTLADQCDLIHIKTYTFVAATPQTIDMATLADPYGAAQAWARARLLAFRVRWATDNLPLLVGATGANGWTALTGDSTGAVRVYPSSAINDGFTVWAFPQTSGAAISGTDHLLKLDPGTAAGEVEVYVMGCSA